MSADIEIELCLPAVNNQPCNITCRIPDFTEIIDFQCNGSSRGMCHIIFCSPNIIKKKNNTFHLQIPSLSYSNDGCEWNCKYGRNVSPSAKLTIFSKLFLLVIVNFKKQFNDTIYEIERNKQNTDKDYLRIFCFEAIISLFDR